MKRSIAAYFSKGEWLLWGGSVCGILLAFLAFDRESWMTLAASLIGVTSLIFNAKGNPAGQALIILFSLLYGAISYSFAYYGEMITYLGMSAPMAVFALISWLRHPYQGNRSQVQVNQITRNEVLCMLLLTGGGDAAVLLHSPVFPHRQPAAQHDLRHHQLSGGVPDLPAQPLVRSGLWGK